jgi:hypothetical protein
VSATSDEGDRRAVEAWFRRRGLPLIIRRRLRGGRLLQRSTPALVFLLVVDPLLSGLDHLVNFDDRTFEQRIDNPGFVVGLLALTVASVVVPVLAGALVSRLMRGMPEPAQRTVAWTAVVLTVVALPLTERLTGLRSGLWTPLLIDVLSVPVLLLLVHVGAGSIVAWALRSAVRQLGAVGMLASRALPLLMLVVLFSFFGTEVWQVADALPRWRLWLVIAFLGVLAVLFISSVLTEELREMVGTMHASQVSHLLEHVAGTPLADLVDEDQPRIQHPLARSERVNIVLVLFLAQALQIVVFSVLVFALFMVFGALTVRQSVVAAWVGRQPTTGVLFGIELPVSNALVQVSLFLAVFSGLYFAASAATDPHYRKSFFDPLIAEVRLCLSAREVYLARWPTAA